MERGEPEGVGGNELGRHTTPVAASNDGDPGFVRSFIGAGWSLLVVLKFLGWSHEDEDEDEEEDEEEGERKREEKSNNVNMKRRQWKMEIGNVIRR